MRKKLVMSMIMIVAMAAFLSGSAVAAFMDVESSGDNSFQAGTLDLKTGDADGVTQTLYATSMKPGSTLGPATIVLRNIGSINAGTLNIDVSCVEDDGVNPPEYPANKTAGETAAVLRVDTLEYGGASLLGGISDWNSNEYIDVEDLLYADLSGQAGISSGSTRDFVIEMTLINGISNDFQADGIDIELTFILN